MLESRRLLAVGSPGGMPALSAINAVPSALGSLSPLVMNAAPKGFTPSEIQKAYSFDQISGDGSGQTIAIIDGGLGVSAKPFNRC
jgi:hypothetical protein